MSGPGARLLGAYPRWWRERYGEELAAVLEARPPGGRARLDLLRGALDAWLRGDPRRPSGRDTGSGSAAALLGGAAWTIAAVGSLAGPTPLDWPGYRAELLPLAALGVALLTVATLAVLRRGWLAARPDLEVATIALPATGSLWAIAVLAPLIGGPYGTVTGLAQTLAGVTMALAGVSLLRADRAAIGLAPLLAGVGFLVPSPAGWLVAGAVWTAAGVWLRWLARPTGGRDGWVPG